MSTPHSFVEGHESSFLGCVILTLYLIDEYLHPNIIQMAPVTTTKPAWLLVVSLNSLGWTTRKPSLWWYIWIQSAFCYLLLWIKISLYINSTSQMLLYMMDFLKMSIWSNHLVMWLRESLTRFVIYVELFMGWSISHKPGSPSSMGLCECRDFLLAMSILWFSIKPPQ